MQGLRGSFLGFTFNNVHSSVLGITHTSDGSRFNYNLIPSVKDLVVEPTGADGQYFFGAIYTKRDFVVNYAFEGITEQQLSDIKRLWNDKKIHDLIFDELPYKVYSAKITGNSQMKHLVFDEKGERIYKGEGSFNFTCYFPFARSRYEYQQDYIVDNIHEWVDDTEDYVLREDAILVKEGLLLSARVEYEFFDDEDNTVNGELIGDANQFTDWLYDDSLLTDSEGEYDSTFTESEYGLLNSDYNNYSEWIESSRIPDNLEYGRWDAVNGCYHLYNAGDIPTPFKIWFRMPQNTTNVLNFTISCGDKVIQFTDIKNTTLNNYRPDYYCVFDVATNSVEGYSADRKQTGTLYNSHIAAGAFFELPTGEQDLYISGATPYSIEIKYYYL